MTITLYDVKTGKLRNNDHMNYGPICDGVDPARSRRGRRGMTATNGLRLRAFTRRQTLMPTRLVAALTLS
ncbi:hypothetical protein [Methylobacterium sp.]|uniref:hypothetical protein n=1 Tax=Methylobacterium sp. TaxID=409 RepID=UPI003B02AF47